MESKRNIVNPRANEAWVTLQVFYGCITKTPNLYLETLFSISHGSLGRLDSNGRSLLRSHGVTDGGWGFSLLKVLLS